MANKLFNLKINRGYEVNGESKNRWVQIGMMTQNNGAGYTVHLDVLPLIDPASGRPEKMSVFKYEPKQQEATNDSL